MGVYESVKSIVDSIKVRNRIAAMLLALSAVSPIGAAQSGGSAEPLEVLQVRPNFYMIAGAGGNIGVQIGSDGVVLVDSGRAETSGQVIAAVRKFTDKPIRYIINTSADADHVGGNAKVAQAGKTFFDVGGPRSDLAKAMTNGGAAAILAPDTVLSRMSETVGKGSAFPSEGWPTEAFFQSRKTIYLNHEGIEILRQPAAHSDSDSFVFFRGSDVVMAGEVLDTTQFPRIDLAHGGSIQGEIDALNRLSEITIPSVPLVNQEGGTYVISGHGRICDQGDVVDYRDMVVVVRDVIQDMIKRGMTLEQIKAASPAKPYETQYGTTAGSTNAFVEAVYKSLTAKK
jgi:glyoxylase-like metal-dependent hydrolase (beta-lactamase superfamily II)